MTTLAVLHSLSMSARVAVTVGDSVCCAAIAKLHTHFPHGKHISDLCSCLGVLRRALGRQDAAFVVHALCFMAHVRVWGWHTSEQASRSGALCPSYDTPPTVCAKFDADGPRPLCVILCDNKTQTSAGLTHLIK